MSVKNAIRQIFSKKIDREQTYYLIAICVAIWIAIIYILVLISSFTRSSNLNQRISLDLNAVEVLQLQSDAELTRAHNGNCSFWDCFNVYRCGEKMSIYIYPLVDYVEDEQSTLSVMSKEFFEILKIIIESPYYTSNPNEACILVPSIDMLNLKRIDLGLVAKALATLP